jgi:hypothetical protein
MLPSFVSYDDELSNAVRFARLGLQQAKEECSTLWIGIWMQALPATTSRE